MASLPATRPASRRTTTPSAASSSSTQFTIALSSCVLAERSRRLADALGPATGRNA